jgi:hypothetical protein
MSRLPVPSNSDGYTEAAIGSDLFCLSVAVIMTATLCRLKLMILFMEVSQRKVYEKPNLRVMPVHWAKWSKVAKKSLKAAFDFPWAKEIQQEFSASKCISIPTDW